MLLLSLNTMLHLELPHLNVLSKVDLIKQYGKLGEKRRGMIDQFSHWQVVQGAWAAQYMGA